MAKISSTGKLIDVLKEIHVNDLYRQVKGVLPNWLNSSIRSVLDKHEYIPLVQTHEIQPKYKLASEFLIEKIGRKAIGDYLEFGVSRGTSLSIMHKVVKKLELDNVRIFGFDSFEGMPNFAASEDRGKWRPGQFVSSLEETMDFLNSKGIDWSRTFLIKGWFSDTLDEEVVDKYKISKASLIMVDCDIYTSTVQALNFCKPLIKDTSIVFFDDWIEEKGFGEFQAWEEFLQQNRQFTSSEFNTYKPTGKVFLIQNTLRNPEVTRSLID